MLDTVRLMNFKSFSDVCVPFKPLTLQLGANGAGKSSVIQALLMLRQSIQASDGRRATLNGPLTRLGVGRDILRQGAEDEIISIEVKNDESLASFRLEYEPEADSLAMDRDGPFPEAFAKNYFGYLTAERIGPRLMARRSLQDAESRNMGVAGESALAVLEYHRAEILDEHDPRRGGRPGSLEEIFQYYIGEICPTSRVELSPYGNVDSIGSSFIFTAPGGLPGLPMRPTNVGFGLSYALPIIVGALTAKRGGMLIIENPEAHLHTTSQRAMLDLLYKTAQFGVQVIVESHSREAFHWLRNRAIRGEIDGSLASINYFEAEYGSGGRESRCVTLASITDKLDTWPSTFFDAYGSPTDLIAPV